MRSVVIHTHQPLHLCCNPRRPACRVRLEHRHEVTVAMSKIYCQIQLCSESGLVDQKKLSAEIFTDQQVMHGLTGHRLTGEGQETQMRTLYSSAETPGVNKHRGCMWQTVFQLEAFQNLCNDGCTAASE